MCTNTCTETSQRTRKSTRTLFVVKQRKETVTDLEVLYNYVVDPAASQPEPGDLWGDSERTLPSAFLELMTARKPILWPLRIPFCVLQRSLPPCSVVSQWSNYLCELKIDYRFQILIFCVVVARSPSLSFRSYVIMRSWSGAIAHTMGYLTE